MLSVPAEANIEAQQKHGQGLADLTQQQVSLLPLGDAETSECACWVWLHMHKEADCLATCGSLDMHLHTAGHV